MSEPRGSRSRGRVAGLALEAEPATRERERELGVAVYSRIS